MTACCQPLLVRLGGLDAAQGGTALQHEAQQPGEDGGHRPRGVPRVRVVVGDGQAEPRVRLEAPVRRRHVDRGGLERELGGEDQLAVVRAAGVGTAKKGEKIYI